MEILIVLCLLVSVVFLLVAALGQGVAEGWPVRLGWLGVAFFVLSVLLEHIH